LNDPLITIPDIFSMEAEQAVLGSMLIDNGCITTVRAIVKPEMFHLPQHQEICDVIFDLDITDGKADALTVLDQAKSCKVFRGLFDEAGAREYLFQLAKSVPTTVNVESYAQIVARKARARDAATRAAGLLQAASTGQDMPTLRSEAEGLLGALEEPERRENPLRKFLRELGEQEPRILTGYNTIDRVTGGLRIPSLSSVGARPRIGKTAFALNIMLRHMNANPGHRVLLFSLEMTEKQIIERVTCILASINYQWYNSQERRGAVAEQNMRSARQCVEDLLARDQFEVYEDVNQVEHMAAIVARMKPALVVVDYLQKVRTAKTTQDRRNEIDHVCGEFKNMALRNNCHVMMLSQLSRWQGMTDVSRPYIHQLKESGAIEAESDYIFMLHRPGVNSEIEEEREETKIYLDKDKFGETGVVDLCFQGEYQRFLEADKRGAAPPPPLARQTEIWHSDFVEIAGAEDMPF